MCFFATEAQIYEREAQLSNYFIIRAAHTKKKRRTQGMMSYSSDVFCAVFLQNFFPQISPFF
ncbi:MAG: hypothetical protein EAZ92_01305 [Candidatus Kapaibacterium sp.]|nr:MAG: hypothetical protein EAZ92_01305 [Candidatus Kapabacteria bacterium]